MLTDYGSPVTGPTPRASRPKPSIDALMTAYLAEVAPPAAKTSARRQARNRPAESLELLRHGLDGYGYQHLGKADLARWQAAFDAGDESAFCRIAGASVLLKYLDEFLGYFLIRKVAMPDDEVAATIEDVRAFVEWLFTDAGEITPAGARRALGRLASASAGPARRRAPVRPPLRPGQAGRGRGARRAGEAAFEEIVDDYLVIERVAPGTALVPRRRRAGQGARGRQCRGPSRLDGQPSARTPRDHLGDPRGGQRLPGDARLTRPAARHRSLSLPPGLASGSR